MIRILIGLALCITACNNSSEAGKSEKTTVSDSSQVAHTWSKEERNEFLLDCIENAKAKVGEDTAYIKCRCVLLQIEKQFPNLDSASAVLVDTTRAAEMIRKCE